MVKLSQLGLDPEGSTRWRAHDLMEVAVGARKCWTHLQGETSGVTLFCPMQQNTPLLGQKHIHPWSYRALYEHQCMTSVWPYFHVATCTGNSTKAWTCKVRGPRLSGASSIPNIHLSWVLPFFPAHKSRKRPKALSPHCIYFALCHFLVWMQGVRSHSPV